eukprot:augustus_masked-scaffold_53-processed-gene-1.34-mRNA-1 protein AED:1.00 eAED:1.00 QI:0/0/0/0/1/1/2/0/754
MQMAQKLQQNETVSLPKRMKIEYYFDVVSPYTALCLKFLRNYQPIWNIDLCLYPVSLHEVTHVIKNKPHGHILNKYRQMKNELQQEYLPKLFNYEMKYFPKKLFELAKNIHLFQQSIISLQWLNVTPETQLHFVEILTDTIYQGDEHRDANGEIIISEELLRVCLLKAGFDGDIIDRVVLESQNDETRTELLRNCEELVRRGGFGTPTMFISDTSSNQEDIMIFGSDRPEVIIGFNQGKEEVVTLDSILVFSVAQSNQDSSLVLFNEDYPGTTVACQNPANFSTTLVEGATTVIGSGDSRSYHFTVTIEEIFDPFVPQVFDVLIFALIDDDECSILGRELLIATIVIASNSPTLSPTEPLEEINTYIPWNRPSELQRWSNWFQVTRGETITFNVLQEHNLLELENRDAYDSCNVDALGEAGFIVDGMTMESTVDFHDPGEMRYFTCNKTAPEGFENCTDIIDCICFNQKIRVTVVERGEEYRLNWVLPQREDEAESLKTVHVIDADQPVRFIKVTDNVDIKQFSSKQAFDACIFDRNTTREIEEAGLDFEIGGNPSFIISTADDTSEKLYRDFLQGTLPEYQHLYFGSSTEVSCPWKNWEVISACKCGLKIEFTVNAINAVPTEAPTNEPDEELLDLFYANAAFIGIGVVGGVLFVLLFVKYSQNRRKKESLFFQRAERAFDRLERTGSTPSHIQKAFSIDDMLSQGFPPTEESITGGTTFDIRQFQSRGPSSRTDQNRFPSFNDTVHDYPYPN